MRVIQQIIEYLAERGELSDEELSYLRSEGFSPFPTDYSEPTPDEAASPYEDHPDHIAEPEPRRRARRRTVPENGVGVGRLKAAIASRLGEWAEPLAGLLHLARLLDPSANIITAPLLLVQADAEVLFRITRDAVDSRAPSLKTLWKSVDFSDFRDPVTEDKDTKRPSGVLRSYRPLLRTLHRQDAPGCGWLLRYWQVRWAVQLAEAQRRLLQVLGRLYREDFALLNRELSRERHEGAFWAFTLLYSANRYAEGGRPGVPNVYGDERSVGATPPEQEVWLRAWSQALLMAPGIVVPFLRVHGTDIGLQAVSVDQSGQVILWNVRTGNEVRRFLGHDGTVSAVLFTPDGRHLLTGCRDGTARLWDAATGRELTCFDNRNANGDPAWCLAFSPDGTQLATGSGESGKVCIWEVATGKRLRVFPANPGATWSLAWSPDGQYLAAGGRGGLRFYDPESGKRLRHLFGTATVTCLAFSADGGYLAAGDDQGWVHLWTRTDAPTRQPGGEYGNARQFYKHAGYSSKTSVQWITFTGDSASLFSGGDDGLAKLVHISQHLTTTLLRGHPGSVCSTTLSPEEDLALTTGDDGTARVWRMDEGKEIRRFTGHVGTVWAGAFRPGTLGMALVCPTRWDKTF